MSIKKSKKNLSGNHFDAAEQQRALNFELVASYQLFSVILVACNAYSYIIQNSAPSVARQRQCDIPIVCKNRFLVEVKERKLLPVDNTPK